MRDNGCVPFFVFSCRFIDFASATGYRRGEENDGQEVGALLHVLAATGGEINGRHNPGFYLRAHYDGLCHRGVVAYTHPNMEYSSSIVVEPVLTI